MFIELLTKSADLRYSDKVHPNYQGILSSLDSDDAKLLEFMFTRKYLVKAKFKDVVVALNDKDKDLFNSNRSINFPVPGIPFLEIIRYSGHY